ncbi:heavy metal translocating P-type ATPase, partial [bacterium]|nr:heavy metal translocating P-type ATPase [bacterium]
MNEQIITTVTDRALCLHCGLPIMDVDRKTDRATFCCIGCETVYQTLEQLGLMDFYKYRGDTSGRRIANDRSSSQYDMLDRKEISENFTTVVEGELRRASFDLAGIHCAGCVWLLEALPKILPAVKNSRVNFGLGKLDLIYDAAQVSLSRIAKEISKLGYEVKFSTGLAKFGLSQSQGKHAELLRLGIAAVCAGNTMMFAVSLWQGIATGIESQYGNLFRWVSLLVSIPAVFYAGFPFYRNAWNALRLGRFHIDLPLSIAMLGAFTASVVNTWAGRANVYFDSVCALIFLLLVGRFLQQRALDRARSHTESAWSLFPAQAYECRATEIHEIPLQLVQVGNLYEVLPGTRVPVDGIIEVGNSDLDTSILTGESQAQPVTVNDLVFAGSLCLDGRIRIRAISTAIDSRVGKILTELKSENSSRPQLLNLTDRASSYFVGGVLLLGIFTFIYWAQFDFWSALDNTVALLVVSCPCALGIAAPLAFTRAAGMASQHGMLLKSEEALERIANIRTVCFDKTGTLTTGAPLVEEFNLIDQSCTATELLAIVSALTNYHLAHPVSRALYDYAKTHSSAKQQIGNFRAIPSAGIEGQDQCGREWRIGSLNWHQQIAGFNAGRQFADLRLQSPIILSRDGELIAYFLLADTIKAEASEL